MKKILAILMALAMIFALAACGTKEEAAETASVASPMVEFSSLEELNEAYGVNLASPGVMGVSDESFAAIDAEGSDEAPIAQYKFSVNGHAYTLRASAALDDISGIYVDGSTMFAALEDGVEANIATADYYGARWYTIDAQYCLTTETTDLSAETFAAIVDEMITLTGPFNLSALPENTELLGELQDSYSQRAVMSVTQEEGQELVTLDIHWGSSASEYDCWHMLAGFSEDGLFSYNGGTHERVTMNEDGSESVETIASDLSGYFVYDPLDTSLSWEGAPEADCQSCVFVMVNPANAY